MGRPELGGGGGEDAGGCNGELSELREVKAADAARERSEEERHSLGDENKSTDTQLFYRTSLWLALFCLSRFEPSARACVCACTSCVSECVALCVACLILICPLRADVPLCKSHTAPLVNGIKTAYSAGCGGATRAGAGFCPTDLDSERHHRVYECFMPLWVTVGSIDYVNKTLTILILMKFLHALVL